MSAQARAICACREGASRDLHANRWGRRGLTALEWAVPGAVLALMPKCPGCVAAYLAVATGVGISASAAAYVRTALMAACVLTLLLLAARFLRTRLLSVVAAPAGETPRPRAGTYSGTRATGGSVVRSIEIRRDDRSGAVR